LLTNYNYCKKLLHFNCFIINNSPRDRVNALLQFMKFIIPTQKAIEVEDVSKADADREYLLQLLEIPEEKFEKLHGLN
ncbi:MAG TPA: hypothetical protein DIT52_03330, partial [Flavobacteriaceae bacterium]|nr:hypothetical protein [Flavobacteriaceae bacterium]